jgi:hypothetical protein
MRNRAGVSSCVAPSVLVRCSAASIMREASRRPRKSRGKWYKARAKTVGKKEGVGDVALFVFIGEPVRRSDQHYASAPANHVIDHRLQIVRYFSNGEISSARVQADFGAPQRAGRDPVFFDLLVKKNFPLTDIK